MSTQTLDSPAASARPRAASGSALLALITRLHFYVGLFVGPFILVAAVTGTLFVLTPQLESVIYADQLRTTSTGTARPLADQVEAAQRLIGPGPRLFAVRPAPGPGQTTRVMFTQPGMGDSESRALFVDPVTLEIKGDMTVYGTSGTLPFRTKLDYLHRNLMLGAVGRNYSELAASWLWFATVGGMVLWFARRGRAQPAAARPSLARTAGAVGGDRPGVFLRHRIDLVQLGRRARGPIARATGVDHAIGVAQAAGGRRHGDGAGRRARASSWRPA